MGWTGAESRRGGDDRPQVIYDENRLPDILDAAEGALLASGIPIYQMAGRLGHSIRLGLRMNETLDIHFDRGDLFDPNHRAGPCLQAFLKSARQWIERKGYQTAFIWVLENKGDGGGYGIHAHVMIHVPDAVRTRFHQLKGRWARKAGLNMAISGVVKRKPLPSLKAAKGKLQYMSKDLDPRFWHLFRDSSDRVHLDDRGKPSDQPIYCKKCGVSRNIDIKARLNHQVQILDEEGLGRGVEKRGQVKITDDIPPHRYAA